MQSARSLVPVALLVTTLGAGCFIADTGASPPHDEFYFPTGLIVSPGGKTLYVINSDFDLQYTGGTVLAVDLGVDPNNGLRPKLKSLLHTLHDVTDGKLVADAQGAAVAKACRVAEVEVFEDRGR